MSKEFSSLVKKIKPSFTLQMTARAAELRSQGEDVINLVLESLILIHLITSLRQENKLWWMDTQNIRQVQECSS